MSNNKKEMARKQTVVRSDTNHVVQDIEDSLATTKEPKDVTIFIGKGTLRARSEFALIFYESFLDTIDFYNLGKTDIKVLMGLLLFLSRGNVVQLTQSTIAKRIHVQPFQVSRSFARLKESKLLIEDGDKSLFLNPQVISKESLRDTLSSHAYSLAKAQTPHLNNF
jgi:hypothetical protein